MINESPEPAHRLLRRARIALSVVREVEDAVDRGDPADRRLTAVMRSHREYGSRDRRFYGDLTFACLRWRGWTGAVRTEGPHAAVLAHLLDHAAPLPEIAVLAADIGLPLPAENPLAGGTLAERAMRFAELAGRIVRPEELVPAWVPGLLVGPPEIPAAELFARLLESFQTRPPLWFRASGRPAEAFAARLRELGIVAAAGPLPGSVRIDGHPHIVDLDRTVGPRFEVQDLSSQVVGLLCDPRPGERWWDACAGAGGKALHLADLMGRTGEVLATDRRAGMLTELAGRLRRAGGSTVTPRRHDAALPLPGEPRFDGVLVDAPCSGMGTWSRNPDARWRETEEHVRGNAALQARFLANAAGHVRPGGRLVYSVCTLTGPETVDVAAAFLAARPDFSPAPEPLRWHLPFDAPGGAMFVARFHRRETGGTMAITPGASP